MSDTVIFNRRISGAFKSVVVYALISICLCVGAAMFALGQSDWDSWWYVKRIGWALLLIGNTINTCKAATSKSTRKEEASV